jgi:AcrR family transcriptional regulator
MGIPTPTSVYAAFGSKEELFREAVELYQATIGGKVGQAMLAESDTRKAVSALLHTAVDVFSARGTPKGCLVMGAANCTTESVQSYLHGLRQVAPRMIKARLEKGVLDGDLPKRTNTAALGSFYASLLYGIALRARDGVPRKTLGLAADAAMAAWDALLAGDFGADES